MSEIFKIEDINDYIDQSTDRKLTSPNKDNKIDECQRICFINFKNSEKSLIDNDTKEKDHKNNLVEDEKKLICQKCGKTNKNFYKCFDCKLILCKKCIEESRHDKLIEYELFNIIVLSQLEGSKCELDSINAFKDLKSNINLVELRKKICNIKNKIDDIVVKLNKIKENLDFYYEINCNISDNLKNNKYEIFETNDKINIGKKNIIKEIDDIINNNKIEGILNNLNKIYYFKIPSKNSSTNCAKDNKDSITRNKSNSITKNSRSDIQNLIEDTTQKNEKKEEIIMKLKFEKNNKIKKLRIFGDKFVENNKEFKMYIEGKDRVIIYEKNNSTQNTEELFTYEMIKSEIDLKDIKNIDLDKDIKIHLNSPNIITNLSFMFCNCYNLLTFEAFSNYSNITNMSNMFYNCTSLNSLNMSKWSVSKVTDINGIFANCKKLDFESFSDISNWDTSNVIDMSYAFSNCESLKSLSKISYWNTSNVVKMNGMFKDCIHLKDIKDLKWDTSNVDNMNFMFCNCKDLVDISFISELEFSKVIYMNNIFAECSSLIDISNFPKKDAPKVTDISFMFYDCIKLEKLPEKFGFNENIVNDISYMFYNTKIKFKDIKSQFLDNNHYQKADKTEIIEGLNKNINCLII